MFELNTSCSPDRVQKLKDARTQATKEIEEYRKQKEQQFKSFEASVRPPEASHSASSSLTSHSMLGPLRALK